ncbi:ABC transporter substrate-binding protein [Halocatena marina]|uniref:ABC transporter substrate-binding protein n=1 Tax=Halocatena marina TaxID=2934937 RepID=UPI00200BA92E|nr:ABC transporter substrate-binding protein [Halocatena marina]
MPSRHNEETSATRRRLLATLGTMGVAGIAGCGSGSNTPTASPEGKTSGSSDGGGGTATSGDEMVDHFPVAPEGEPVEPIYDIAFGMLPGDVNMLPGPVGGLASWQTYTRMTTAPPWANRQRFDAETYWHLVTEDKLEDDNKTRITKFNDEFTWHDGKPVTAEDQFLLAKIQRKENELAPDTEPQQTVEMIDEQTLKRTFTTKAREDFYFMTEGRKSASPSWDRDLVRPWYEKIMDATTESELNSITEEANKPENKLPLSDRIGTSIWQVDTVNEQSAIYTKYEDHPYADQQNIEKLRINFVSGESQSRLAIKNDQIDGAKGKPEGTPLPDGMTEYSWPDSGGNKYRLNWTDKHLGKRKVRQALAYLVDHNAVVTNRQGNGFPPELHNGMTGIGQDTWLSDSHVESLNNYGASGQPQKAAELLRSAGYSKNSDGIWADKDGDTISWRMVDIVFWKTIGPTIRSQLKKFGIEIEYNLMENVGDFVTLSNEGPNFGEGWDLIIWHQNGGGAGANHPAGYYRSAWHSYIIHKGLDESGKPTEFGFAGHPNEYEIPTKVGDMEANGETETLNLWDKYEAVAAPKTSNDELLGHAEDLSWWWNYEIPALQTIEYQIGWAGDSQNYNHIDYTHDDNPNRWFVLNYNSIGLDRGWYHSKVK